MHALRAYFCFLRFRPRAPEVISISYKVPVSKGANSENMKELHKIKSLFCKINIMNTISFFVRDFLLRFYRQPKEYVRLLRRFQLSLFGRKVFFSKNRTQQRKHFFFFFNDTNFKKAILKPFFLKACNAKENKYMLFAGWYQSMEVQKRQTIDDYRYFFHET